MTHPESPSWGEVAVTFIAIVVTVALLAIALFAVGGCSVVSDVESTAKGVGADLAELSYCEIATCGQVFLCMLPEGGTSCKLSSAPCSEWCWVDDNATTLRDASGALSCAPTPRGGALGWPCIYGCEAGHRDSNAYQGSYCGPGS